MFFSFKTVGKLQVIHQPLSLPKQIRAGEYAVGRKIGLERVNFDQQSIKDYGGDSIVQLLCGFLMQS
jgi:hypothetical protein